jgi:hypothetical protein
MDRLNDAAFGAHLLRAGWEARRAVRAGVRRYGLVLPAVLGCVVVMLAALALAQQAGARGAALRMELARRMAAPAVSAPPETAPAGAAGARARLRAFDAQLLAHADIPFVVQDLLALGEAQGLSMQRGSYRAQPDSAGAFLRYRMNLPVKGSGPAIQRFIQAALRKHGNLALDGVQFTRARIGASEIEARIQWALLTTLPAGAGAGRTP